MSDHSTEPFEGHEADEAIDSYEWDYEEEEPERRSGILWGRVVALLAFLVLAFLLGRATATGDDGRAERLGATVEQLEDENDQLRAELDAASAVTPEPETTPTEEAATEEDGATTYVVEQGDTLRGIAQSFYGDAAFDDCIAAANDINDPTELRPGQELVIPDEADC